MNQLSDWLSAIPAHWKRTKLKYLASLKSGDAITGDQISVDGEYPVFGGNGPRGFTTAYTHRGDHVLIGRQGALCGNINYASGSFWASEHAVVVELIDKAEVLWLGELLRSMNLNQYSQSAAQPGIAVEVIGNLDIPVPPLKEQSSIAKYLKRETTNLDALVAEKDRVLRLLAEKRRAIIARAATHGLDVQAPLRDSGIPWLGEIPFHWSLIRAKFLWQEQALPVTPESEMVTCFRDGQVTLRRNRREEGFTNAIKELGYQGIRAGQLVLHSMDAFAGAIGVSDSDGKCTPEYIICDPIGEDVYNPYFGHLLRIMALSGFIQASCPAVRERAPRIHFSDFGDMFLPVPPMAEQRAIVTYIATETAKLDNLRAATERTISLLKERRAALIAAAVTGQIPIGGAGACP